MSEQDGEHLRDDVIDFFQRAAHCERWEFQGETAAAFAAVLDRYVDWRISRALEGSLAGAKPETPAATFEEER